MRNVRVVLIAGMMAAVLGVATPRSEAAVITLSDLNSVLNIETSAADPSGQGPSVVNWFVDGVDHLFQQWFWYRIGPAGPEAPIDTISAPAIAGPFDTDFDPGFDTVTLRYTNATLQVDVKYSLEGGTTGSNSSDLGEQVTVYNRTQAPLPLVFFQYTDFDLGGTPGGDFGTMVNANTVRQSEGGFYVSETVSTPAPSRFEVNVFPITRNALNDGVPTTLNNSPSAAGDVTWAFQWDVNIPVGGVFQVSKNKRIGVPEPATLLLFGTALIGAAGMARRRKTQQMQI